MCQNYSWKQMEIVPFQWLLPADWSVTPSFFFIESKETFTLASKLFQLWVDSLFCLSSLIFFSSGSSYTLHHCRLLSVLWLVTTRVKVQYCHLLKGVRQWTKTAVQCLQNWNKLFSLAGYQLRFMTFSIKSHYICHKLLLRYITTSP